jgi:hypothetical protein
MGVSGRSENPEAHGVPDMLTTEKTANNDSKGGGSSTAMHLQRNIKRSHKLVLRVDHLQSTPSGYVGLKRTIELVHP